MQHLFPLVSECKAPKQGDSIGLACLARGHSIDSVQVTSSSGSQTTTLITLGVRESTQLSFLLVTWKTDPHFCRAVFSNRQQQILIPWPVSWEGKTDPSAHRPSLPETSTTPSIPVSSTSHTQTQATESGSPVDATLRDCRNHTHPPSLYLLQPPLRGPWLQGKATFTCLAVGDDLQEARVSWEVAGAPPSGAVEEGPREEHANGSQSLSSRLAMPVSLWASGSSITCTLSRPSTPAQVASAAPGEHAATAPSSLTVRVLTVRQAASWLLCEVSGFSPPDILLTWLKGRTEVDPAAFATAHPVAQPGNSTFQTWSVLHVLAAQSPGPATYTCVVRHDASRKLFNTSQSLDTGLAMTPPPLQSHDESRGVATDLEDAGGLWPTFAALFLLTLLYSGFVTFIKVK